jgi:hypothetical protein
MWPVVLILACEAFPVEARRTLPVGDSADTGIDSGTIDTADTAPDPGGTDSGAGTEACYLGLARLGVACLPTVPWDALTGADYFWPDPLDEQYPPPTRLLDLEGLDPFEDMRDEASIPILLTTGFRSPAYNASVGGVT